MFCTVSGLEPLSSGHEPDDLPLIYTAKKKYVLIELEKLVLLISPNPKLLFEISVLQHNCFEYYEPSQGISIKPSQLSFTVKSSSHLDAFSDYR